MQKVLMQFAVLIVVVVGLSFVSSRLWGGRPEGLNQNQPLIIEETMTVGQFGQRNELPPMLLKKVFDLKGPADQQRQVATFGMSAEQIVKKTRGLLAIQAEHGSKNWMKILVKFGLWLAFLAFVFRLMVRGRVTAQNRKWLLLAAVVVFGVVLERV
jgi:hypothetical protein